MPGIEGFELPKGLEVDETTRTDRFARFIAEPWEHGYGNTVGNALRRVLLSSMEGVSVSSIRIEGVSHEFSSIPGVIEDVVDIVLNVKKLKFVCDEAMPRRLEVRANKAGEVTGRDIHEDGVVSVVNPDQVICTLDKDQDFRMELELDRGRGYRPSELNKRDDQALGTIPVDCLFSPIERVSYQVQACRVGNQTDYDRLELCIWTDGRIEPMEAMRRSVQILTEHLQVLVGCLGDSGCNGGEGEGPISLSSENELLVETLCSKVESLELSVRAVNVLQTLQITTLGELVDKSEQDLLKHRNCGKKTVQEIKDKLRERNLVIGQELPEEVKQEVSRRLAAEASQNKEEN